MGLRLAKLTLHLPVGSSDLSACTTVFYAQRESGSSDIRPRERASNVAVYSSGSTHGPVTYRCVYRGCAELHQIYVVRLGIDACGTFSSVCRKLYARLVRLNVSLLHRAVTQRRDVALFSSSDKSVVSLTQPKMLRLRHGPVVEDTLFCPQVVDDIVEERRKSTTDRVMERAASLRSGSRGPWRRRNDQLK